MSQPPGNSSAPTAYSSENRHSSETISYKPDEANNVWEKTNRLNEVTRITYDKANRPSKVDYLKDGSAETFGYDPAGNLNAAANNTVAYGFQYDRLNRLIQKTDGRGRSLSFSFDKAGNILTKTTYQGSATLRLQRRQPAGHAEEPRLHPGRLPVRPGGQIAVPRHRQRRADDQPVRRQRLADETQPVRCGQCADIGRELTRGTAPETSSPRRTVKELRDFMEGIAARNGQGAQRFRTRS